MTSLYECDNIIGLKGIMYNIITKLANYYTETNLM